ncbi:MAG: phosphomethylpyrimidine synthase ThiC [Candidatus Omnitrophica bacterium]|nr:phosphomethylpyrimidine synthase ThiC [Candidatus Omnitrophota bacterium]
MKFLNKNLLKKIAKLEKVEYRFLEKQISKGRVVIPLNKKYANKKYVAIGDGLKIKINTNIGTSTEHLQIHDEIKKLETAIKYGTDTAMDLSTAGDLDKIRKKIIHASTVPIGTVPIYQAAVIAEKKYGDFTKMRFDDIWDVLKIQAEDGVDFFTIHAGILKKALKILTKNKRVGGIVSRGGAILARWMYINNAENPLYENFDAILELAKEYNITLSLGDALRPGAIADSTDKLQLFELNVLSELVKKALKKEVQVLVEGPGHILLNQIPYNVYLEKKLCFSVPFYILGPLPIDIAAGYDHISASIGGAIAALFGANFLCVVTPAEHLRHPTIDDIKEGVIAARIAAHSVDVLNFEDEWRKDYQLSLYRAKRKWADQFSILLDKEKAQKYHNLQNKIDVCSMCGKFCSLKIIETCKLLK